MKTTQEHLEKFFADYEARINIALTEPSKFDVDATINAYTECFMEAHPKGVTCFQNDEKMRQTFPQMFEAQRKLGAKSMRIISREIMPLDEFHAMAKIHWEARYIRKDGQEVVANFDEFYFVQTLNQISKVFAYIAGDQEKWMKDNGLI
jgi:hypothetical protein